MIWVALGMLTLGTVVGWWCGREYERDAQLDVQREALSVARGDGFRAGFKAAWGQMGRRPRRDLEGDEATELGAIDA